MLDPMKSKIRDTVPTKLLRTATATIAVFVATGLVYWGVPLILEYSGLSWWSLVGLGAVVAVAAAAGWRYWDEIQIACVEVEGPIGSDSDAVSKGINGHDIADAIESAGDRGADALLVVIDSPGGEIVPSDRIRQAVSEFDGPTAAFANGICASGGYLAACASDHIVAHESSLVGSIGVIAAHLNLEELAGDHGIEYEGFTAGEFKDAGHPLKELEDGEREYFQNLVDKHYERFVDVVSNSRGIPEDTIRELGARVFLGAEATDKGLVDETGTREDARTYLAETLGRDEDELEEWTYQARTPVRLLPAAMVKSAAFAFGAGVGSHLRPPDLTQSISGSIREWFDG